MKTETELNHDFEMRDNEQFTKSFYRGFIFAVAVGFIFSIGLLWAVVNADKIDHFFSEILKAIFL